MQLRHLRNWATIQVFLTIAVTALVVLMTLQPVLASGIEVGTITRQQAEATAIRNGETITLAVNAPVHENDELRTGLDSRLELTLKDGTTVTLGENGALVVDRFVFDPNKSAGTAIINSLKGPLRFISGRLGTLSNKRVEVKTPFATLDVRGTDFFVGPATGIYGVLLFEGEVSVTNSAGNSILSEAGTGINLTDPEVPPGAVDRWSDDRVEAAEASVAFN